jgi:hypothetical protein
MEAACTFEQTARQAVNSQIPKQNKTNPVALSPQANYTDLATPTGRRILVPDVDRGVSRGQHGGTPTAVNLSFLDRSRYFSFM